ncbi:type IV toxin-antitoxin system AbiEi family antitoxin domain-containing protein [Actinomyces ruminicola]|uniref:type IV toxin-antitoxin system AbiEi family antitoxin domain-containing protein n=1 Tax=Actinomyces ruminicola TaxID=332524 RepID=UPI000B895813
MRTADALRTLSSATGSQRGLITTAQAARVGIDRTSLTCLTTSEALTRVRHGVYARTRPCDTGRAFALQDTPQTRFFQPIRAS